MRKMTTLLVLLFMLGVPTVDAVEQKWSDEGELSSVNTGGNTNVSTFSARNLLKYKFSEHFEGSWKASALSSKSEAVKTAERYTSELRGDYLVSKDLYVGIIAGGLKDKFAGIDLRYYVGPVVGYKIYAGPKHFLVTESGLDYVTEEYTNNTDSDYLRGRAFILYEFHVTELNKIQQSVEYLHDFAHSDNYNVNSVSALVSVLSQFFSLKTSYEVKYDNEPVPVTLKKTDTILSVSLLVNF